MTKTLELALAKAAALPEAAQERIAYELLERIDTLTSLKAAIDEGVRSLMRVSELPWTSRRSSVKLVLSMPPDKPIEWSPKAKQDLRISGAIMPARLLWKWLTGCCGKYQSSQSVSAAIRPRTGT